MCSRSRGGAPWGQGKHRGVSLEGSGSESARPRSASSPPTPPPHSRSPRLGPRRPSRTSSRPSPPGSPLLPQRGGPGRARLDRRDRAGGTGAGRERAEGARPSVRAGRAGPEGRSRARGAGPDRSRPEGRAARLGQGRTAGASEAPCAPWVRSGPSAVTAPRGRRRSEGPALGGLQRASPGSSRGARADTWSGGASPGYLGLSLCAKPGALFRCTEARVNQARWDPGLPARRSLGGRTGRR